MLVSREIHTSTGTPGPAKSFGHRLGTTSLRAHAAQHREEQHQHRARPASGGSKWGQLCCEISVHPVVRSVRDGKRLGDAQTFYISILRKLEIEGCLAKQTKGAKMRRLAGRPTSAAFDPCAVCARHAVLSLLYTFPFARRGVFPDSLRVTRNPTACLI